MASRVIPINEQNLEISRFASEAEFKMQHMSIEIKAPKINENIRDKSCVIIFPRVNYRINRTVVTQIMKEKWGELFNHVVHFGNVDFSKKWIFCFDTHENNERAIAKDIFIDSNRIKAFHATKKFNILKLDWVPPYTDLNDLSAVIRDVNGITGSFVDARWGRGDKVETDSTQVIMRFYVDQNSEFNPPSYVHYTDEYGYTVFLHLTVAGQNKKCMKCDQEGHIATDCTLFHCPGCGRMSTKGAHECTNPKYSKKNDKNVVYKENSPQKNNSTVENNLIDLEESATQIAPSPKLQYSETVKTKQKLYDEYKMNSMTSLGKINNKNRTPPFDYWNTQKTPIHPEKKLRSSTPQNAIKFDHDRNSLERDLFTSNYTLSPVPSKYLQPIDPHYQTNFPTANEAKEILETNPKKHKKKHSDEDNSLSHEKNNLSEKNGKNNQNESVLNIIDDSASNLVGSENEIKESNNNTQSENDSDPFSKSISNTEF